MGNCNNCGSNNTFGMSRVVGYYSMIENWNGAKQAEHADRQQGDYGIPEHSIKQEKQMIITI